VNKKLYFCCCCCCFDSCLLRICWNSEEIWKTFFFKERKIGKLVGINYFTRETFVLDLVDANRMLLASEKSLKISKLNCSFLVVCLDPVIWFCILM
jgi:hypothetical protein